MLDDWRINWEGSARPAARVWDFLKAHKFFAE